MSKTTSAVVCETNQIQGQNQENVFFHSLFRVPSEFSDTFVRSAKSTAPIQICACFSAQGEDTQAAMALQEVLKQMSALAAQAQLKSVMDYETFTTTVVNVLNNTVCQESVKHNGAKIKVSMSMVVIEGDTLRVMNIGNTHIWLFRQGKMISLTENQTVAHRAVQMGAIPKEAENFHEGKNELTQFLGRFPQDGEVIPDKKVHLKLLDGDEIIFIGTGLDQGVQVQKLGMVIARPTQPETKASDLINLGITSGVKAGLTAMVIHIDSTLLLPGDANIESANVSNNLAVAPVQSVPDVPVPPAPAAPADADAPTIQSPDLAYNINQNMEADATKSMVFESDDEDEDDEDEIYEKPRRAKKEENKNSTKLRAILIGLLIFVICGVIGFLGMYVIFNAAHWTGKLKSPTTTTTTDSGEIVDGQVAYALYDNTSLYVEESLDSQVIDTLSRGEAVTLLAMNDNFAKVRKENGLMGYLPKEMLSFDDPTIGEEDDTVFIDPTPIPTEPSTSSVAPQPDPTTESTTEPPFDSSEPTMESSSETEPPQPSDSSEPSETTQPPTSETPAPSETEPPETTPEPTSETTPEPTSDTTPAPADPAEPAA